MMWIFESLAMNLMDWFQYLLSWAIVFAVISFFLHLEEKLKEKETELYMPDAASGEGKIAMLKALRDYGVLTDEEYETKAAVL